MYFNLGEELYMIYVLSFSLSLYIYIDQPFVHLLNSNFGCNNSFQELLCWTDTWWATKKVHCVDWPTSNLLWVNSISCKDCPTKSASRVIIYCFIFLNLTGIWRWLNILNQLHLCRSWVSMIWRIHRLDNFYHVVMFSANTYPAPHLFHAKKTIHAFTLKSMALKICSTEKLSKIFLYLKLSSTITKQAKSELKFNLEAFLNTWNPYPQALQLMVWWAWGHPILLWCTSWQSPKNGRKCLLTALMAKGVGAYLC